MIKTYTYEEIIQNELKPILIDVRSPAEYAKEHIPHAINIPVLDDEQRKIVGTLFKEKGQRKAIETGLELVGPNLINIYKEFVKYIKPQQKIIVYCARGGMRSKSITSLLQQFSLPVFKLEGGYKGYREYINKNLPDLVQSFTYITLYGPTGTAKTRLLNILASNNYDILDLEACANNRGSLLGSIGLQNNHSQKYFESLVFDSLINAKTKIVFTEGESKRIGSILMPEYLYQKIIGDYKVYIDATLDYRIQVISEEYLSKDIDIDHIKTTLNRLRKYHSNDKIEEYLRLLEIEDYTQVIKGLIVDYYDKVYKSKKDDFEFYLNNTNDIECVNQILSLFSDILEQKV